MKTTLPAIIGSWFPQDQGHLNSVLEGELIIANEQKYGSYLTRKIPRKCAGCSDYLMLVTNIGAGMKVYSSQDLEFQLLGSQTIQYNSCQSYHAVVLGFMKEELKAMPAIQMILSLHQTVDNAMPVGPPCQPVAIEISNNKVDAKAPLNSAHHGRASMLAIALMPAIQKVNWVVDTNIHGRSAKLQGKIAILFFKKLYFEDHKIDLGLAGVEMGDQFEVFGFASENGWTKVHWSEPLWVVEGSLLFMKECGTEDPRFWNNWKTAVDSITMNNAFQDDSLEMPLLMAAKTRKETSQTQTAIPVPPAPHAIHPNCPMLTKEHTTWLNENAILGYAQVVAAVQAQSSGGKRVQGPEIDYVKDHVFNEFLEKFWSPDNEPKTASVLLKLNILDDLDLYHDVSVTMWVALDSDTVEEYQAMAEEANTHAAELPSLSDIYQNQCLIDQATMSMLEHMIGFGPGQLGKVTWIAHCMYEDTDGKVCGVK
ncbi:hypothetical protein ARMGADRAFT_1037405 [Armillaria gallica]|uniref:Uncharacterized protein n=1 Tax=Armillaria gallica TaxID=47427 RepID=A0A2H3CRL4_ARMGA|nr:hypothetical protein ARMGADRAFT_1037405 [Armillaria gallica]